MEKFREMSVAIAGLGVIGGSFALGLKSLGCDKVYGIDSDPGTLALARETGLIREGSTRAGDILSRADLVVIALYPRLVPGFLRENLAAFRKNAVITDATGVKSALAGELEGILEGRPDLDFVLGHPMAGREKKGLAFASEVVFRGANYLICPREQNRPESLELVRDLALALGFARISFVSPAVHDAAIAYTSQLTHAMAVALMTSDEAGRDTGRFIGDSFRDLTRIAKMNEDLWSELFLENREHLLTAMERFSGELEKIRRALETGDAEALKALFRESTGRREAMDGPPGK
jgi:prephenate dehydrogenase